MQLPEHLCPHCRRSVTLIPLVAAARDRHECGVCKKVVSLQPDGELALVLPSSVEIDVQPGVFELKIIDWFVTFGVADPALRFRVERDVVAWTKPPRLGRIRFSEAWNRIPRAALRTFDWRMFERGMRGTNQYETWLDFVFVAHDTSEVVSGHRFDAALDGSVVTTVLQWAHDHGVRNEVGGAAYRSAAGRGAETLRVVTTFGRCTSLTPDAANGPAGR